MPFYIKIARINKKLVIVAYNDHSCLKCAYNRIWTFCDYYNNVYV